MFLHQVWEKTGEIGQIILKSQGNVREILSKGTVGTLFYNCCKTVFFAHDYIKHIAHMYNNAHFHFYPPIPTIK